MKKSTIAGEAGVRSRMRVCTSIHVQLTAESFMLEPAKVSLAPALKSDKRCLVIFISNTNGDLVPSALGLNLVNDTYS